MNKKSDVIDLLDKNDLQSQNKKIRNVIFELLEVK
jgi:probable 50S ribosomal protein L14e